MPLTSPPPENPLSAYNADAEHLRLHSIFHYVVGGLGFLCGSFPLLHVALGLIMFFSPETMNDGRDGPPPKALGLVFAVMGGVFVIMAWMLSAFTITPGRYISQRKKWTASVLCVCTPFGTVLGVFTLIVLLRPSVRQLYGET